MPQNNEIDKSINPQAIGKSVDPQTVQAEREAQKIEGLVTGHVEGNILLNELNYLSNADPRYINKVIAQIEKDNTGRASQHLPPISLDYHHASNSPQAEPSKAFLPTAVFESPLTL